MIIPSLIDQRFGSLVVIAKAEKDKRLHQLWLCRCDCGGLTKTRSFSLRNGGAKSCGCGQRAAVTKAKTTHGLSHTNEYTAWSNMINRCTNPKHPQFKYWGGRGITVCESWRKFENFFKDMGFRPEDNLSLERINNNGNYEPGNCKWATLIEQRNNQGGYELAAN